MAGESILADAAAEIEKLRAENERLTAVLEEAREALKPFHDAVYNDNGEMTVSGSFNRKQVIAGYYAYRKIGLFLR